MAIAAPALKRAHPGRSIEPGPRLAILQLALAMALPIAAAGQTSNERHFLEKVKPLIESRCVSCHGPDKVKGGLRLDSREALLKGGDNGPALKPGKPGDSLVLQAVLHTKPDLEMPPKEQLNGVEIKILERWIRDGAPWPVQKDPGAARVQTPAPPEHAGDAWTDPNNPIVRIFSGQRLDLWSLQPITHPKAPSAKRVRPAPRAVNGIDRFIRSRLARHKLPPSPEADKRTLARRVYYDLTGLPPAPEEMAAFIEDTSRDAYEQLVDRLLASPRYGEHAARQWLDAVRYSDSNGFDWDEYRPQAWRYRDYVIRSLNADKPFDRFIREQLAGDELIPGEPNNDTEQEALIATGYLRIGPQDNSSGLFNEQDRSRAEWMSDLVETTGSAFLGLTLSCCRCHDHKYDPISQADYYRFRAFFEPVRYGDDLALNHAPEQAAIRTHNASVEAELKPVKSERDTLIDGVKERIRAGRRKELPPEEQALLAMPEANRTEEQKARIEKIQEKIKPSDKDIDSALSEAEKARRTGLNKSIEALEAKRRSFLRGLLATDQTNEVRVTRILYQGNHKDERDPVTPGILSILDPNPLNPVPGLNAATTGRRLALANWIASSKNPLTARVLVNRVWLGHFGEALVGTPNDFGFAGERPSHPELLDWLATEFVSSGWSLKSLHRLIVTSATYRQASSVPGHTGNSVDQDNKLLWRQNLRRLTAEQLRDAMLFVSGRLTAKSGGPPIWPELPAEVLQANPAFLDDNSEKTKGWYPSPPEEQGARSIYLIQKRTVRVPFMETFDLPSNEVSCSRRQESVVPPQAFSLLNSPLAIETAKSFADRVRKRAGDDVPAQVREAFSLAFQRNPSAIEQRRCEELVRERNLVELCRALLNVNEFVYVD